MVRDGACRPARIRQSQGDLVGARRRRCEAAPMCGERHVVWRAARAQLRVPPRHQHSQQQSHRYSRLGVSYSRHDAVHSDKESSEREGNGRTRRV
eukprot:scaffold317509_cov33-Tisochrysis_lutea.AAC.3